LLSQGLQPADLAPVVVDIGLEALDFGPVVAQLQLQQVIVYGRQRLAFASGGR
jgi:hypothetical protein